MEWEFFALVKGASFRSRFSLLKGPFFSFFERGWEVQWGILKSSEKFRDKHVCCVTCLFSFYLWAVSRAREAVLDAHFLVLASDLGKEKAKQLRSELSSFDMLRYVETLVSTRPLSLPQGGSCETIISWFPFVSPASATPVSLVSDPSKRGQVQDGRRVCSGIQGGSLEQWETLWLLWFSTNGLFLGSYVF